MLRPPPASRRVSLPARTHHRRGLVLLGLGLFQLWLWGTRIVNLLGGSDGFSAAFVAVHLVLYIAAIGAGVLLLILGVHQLREVRTAPEGDPAPAAGPPSSHASGGRP